MGAVVIVNASIAFIYLHLVGAKHFQGVGRFTAEELLGKPDVNFSGRLRDHRTCRGFRPLVFSVGAGRFRGSAQDAGQHNEKHPTDQYLISQGPIYHHTTF
jgi:hypothetical protein